MTNEIIDSALPEVTEPPALAQTTVARGYVRSTLTTLLRDIAAATAEKPASVIDLRLRRVAAPDQLFSTVFCRNNPPRIGVFPFVADPIHWGHIIAALSVVSVLELDAMVFMPAGDPGAASISDRNAVDEQDRHAMVASAIDAFRPILQYTDVACGTNNAADCAVHDLRQLNNNRDIDFILLYPVRSEIQLRQVMSRMLDSLQDRALAARQSRHHLDLYFIDGFGTKTVQFDPERLWRYRREIGLQLRCRLITIDMPELAPFRSRRYRETGEAALVPRAVHSYATERRLYV